MKLNKNFFSAFLLNKTLYSVLSHMFISTSLHKELTLFILLIFAKNLCNLFCKKAPTNWEQKQQQTNK